MSRSGYPARIDPRARLTIIVLVVVFVVGLGVALLYIDSQRTSTTVQCPNPTLDGQCSQNGP